MLNPGGDSLPAHVTGKTDSLALHYGEDVREDWLGVGLWGIPLPYDWNSDGVKDLLVSCPDTPYKGLYLFINKGTSSRPFFSKAVRLSHVGRNNIRLSEAAGIPHVLSAGKEYPDFFAAPYASGLKINYEGEKLGKDDRKSRSNMWNYADWDGDGLQDIIINSITGKIEWLRNTGSSDGLELEPPRPVEVSWDGKAPKPAWNWWTPAPDELVTQWRTTPYAIDWNGDSLTDLVMVDHEGYLAFYERFRKEDGTLGLMPGKRIFIGTNCSVYDNKKGVTDASEGLLRLNAGEAGKSGRRKICLVDWDGDGLTDLLVDSRNVAWFRNHHQAAVQYPGQYWRKYTDINVHQSIHRWEQ